MELEDGEVFSDVDESNLNTSFEKDNEACIRCKTTCIDKYAFICEINKQHRYCPKCIYESMFMTKYCPSGDKCKMMGEAGPWAFDLRDAVQLQ